MAHPAGDSDGSFLRAGIIMQAREAERALDRAFDLQQAGAPAEFVEAALAEATRLQAAVVDLRERMYGPTLH